jgi:hypothetical protein
MAATLDGRVEASGASCWVLDWLPFEVRVLLADISCRVNQLSHGQGMSAQPQCPSRYRRVNAHFFPPPFFIAAAVKFAMMSSA